MKEIFAGFFHNSLLLSKSEIPRKMVKTFTEGGGMYSFFRIKKN